MKRKFRDCAYDCNERSSLEQITISPFSIYDLAAVIYQNVYSIPLKQGVRRCSTQNVNRENVGLCNSTDGFVYKNLNIIAETSKI